MPRLPSTSWAPRPTRASRTSLRMGTTTHFGQEVRWRRSGRRHRTSLSGRQVMADTAGRWSTVTRERWATLAMTGWRGGPAVSPWHWYGHRALALTPHISTFQVEYSGLVEWEQCVDSA